MGVIDGNVLDAVVDLRVECPGIDLVFKAHTADGPRGIMTGVSTASAVVGAAATGFSLGARGNAAVQATLVIMGQK